MAEHSEQVAEHTEQANMQGNAVYINLHEMLGAGQRSPDQPRILEVPNYLRQGNKEAFEPQAISIGLCHSHNAGLEAMKELKIQFLQKLLREKPENDVSVYLRKMTELECGARYCYAADRLPDLRSEDFVQMLVLDGVFVVQMIRLFSEQRFPSRLIVALFQDMLLVENQLPYFVLMELYGMIESRATDTDKSKKFAKAILLMFRDIVPGLRLPDVVMFGDGVPVLQLGDNDPRFSKTDFKHLLDFVYHWWVPSNLSEDRRNPRDDPPTSCIPLLPISLLKYYLHFETRSNNFRYCATKLKEAGIKFKLLEDEDSMFDIRFQNGTLLIPVIEIGNYTGRFLRNLVAYEEMVLEDGARKYVTDYVIFMDQLIDTPNDVEILCKEGIIFNMLVDDKAVATMFNDLGQGILFHYVLDSRLADSYIDVLGKIYHYCNRPWNKHCRRRWKRWMVNLKQNYFDSPWSLISVLAAVVLLILTFLQTIFSAK